MHFWLFLGAVIIHPHVHALGFCSIDRLRTLDALSGIGGVCFVVFQLKVYGGVFIGEDVFRAVP